MMRLKNLYEKMSLANPAVIVDANHSNSGKQYKQQIRIVAEVLHNRHCDADLYRLVKGVMIESYLVGGSRSVTDPHVFGQSITDPCLGWEDTEALLYKIAEDI